MAGSWMHARSLRWLAAGLALAALAALAIVRCQGGTDRGGGRGAAAGAGSGAASAIHGVDPRAQVRGSISGTVRSEAGEGIARAMVCAGTHDDPIARVLTRELPCAATDARGRYVIAGVLPGLYTISATAKPYMPGVHHPAGDRERTWLELAPGERADGIDVTLRAGGAEVTGVVSDITGGPIAQARVWMGSAQTETDAAGRFSLWVEPGDVWLQASASGYAPAERGGLAPGRVSIALTPESTLSGIVVDAAGAPVAGALVAAEATGPENRHPPSEVSAADGRFTISAVLPGTYEVIARTARGYGRSHQTTEVGFGAHVSGVTVTLHRAFEISGTVMADDRPCVEATVRVRSDSYRDVPVRAGPAGARSAIGLLPGTYTVTAWCDGFAPDPPAEIAITDHDVVGQIWRTRSGATLRGRVLTRRGDPIGGDQVEVSAGGLRFLSERTAPDGKFVIAGLPAATYEVEVSHGSGSLPLAPIAVAERAVIERDLVIDDTGAIRGVVVSAEGGAVAGIRIAASLHGEQSWIRISSTDDDGRFLFDGAPPGLYRLSTNSEHQELEVAVRAGETTEARLVVEARSGVIRGTVVGEDGAPIAGAFVTVSSGYAQDDVSTSTGTGGAFEVRSLRPGARYELTAYRTSGGSATVQDVQVGETVKIQIRSTGSIEGVVIGAPDPVSLSLTGGAKQSLTLFHTGGRYRFTGLPPGSYMITASVEGKHARADVTLAEGEHRRGVDIRVQRRTTITGRMVDARTRAPVAGLRVRLHRPGNDVRGEEAETDADGRFTLRDRAPGAWLILGAFPGSPALCAELRQVTGEDFDAGELPVLSVRPARTYDLGFEPTFSDDPPDASAWRATVASVRSDGPAARAGLREGDVITAVNGTDVTGPQMWLIRALAFASPDGAARVTLARGVTLTIAGAPLQDP